MLGLAFRAVGRFSLLVSYRRLPPALYLHLQSRCAKGAVHEAVLPETQFPYFLGCSPSSHYTCMVAGWHNVHTRSEEHTSELQSRLHLVCRLLLEKKKKKSKLPLTSFTSYNHNTCLVYY